MTPSRELRALDDMNSSRLWMKRATQGGELKVLDAIYNSELWMI